MLAVDVAMLALESKSNVVKPPCAPLTVPALFVMFALPPLESVAPPPPTVTLRLNPVTPPAPPLTVPPLLKIVAVPADPPEKVVKPPTPLPAAPTFVITAPLAVELL